MTEPRLLFFRVSFAVLFAASGVLHAVEPSIESTDDAQPGPLAGHSFHGEAFNEGPRQKATLIPGMAAIEFPTSTKSETAQRFIEQGISQLHGFWYLEAERSFRQAALEDPELAIAHWGMAMANLNNPERARGLIDKAMELRKQNTSRRERLYIEALERFTPKANDDQASKPDKEAERDAKIKRAERYIADFEKILHEYPNDSEAKAFLVVHMWQADRYGVKLTSRYAVNALMSEIFAKNPMHPAHHYRIHLWDSARPDNALQSAAMCGPSSPGIAHMWHMPGHIYSKLKRYGDAAWQQEASARVDHAHMTRARLMPDQIHNFAHNNEWLIRNLLYVGRVDDALEQSRNLVSLPQHPDYNTPEKRGSYRYGRQRLLQTLTQYGLWDELFTEVGGPFLPMTDDADQQEDLLGWQSVASFLSGDKKTGGNLLRSLQRRRLALQEKLLDLADAKADESTEKEPASSPTVDEIKKHLGTLRRVIARCAAASATVRKDTAAFKRHAAIAKLDKVIHAQWLADAGDLPAAIKLAKEAVNGGQGQVRPLAVLVDLYWRSGDQDEAKKQFEQLRKLAADADIQTPILDRLRPIADELKLDDDWRIARKPADDLGDRPSLDQLGPFQWQPATAPTWTARTADDAPVSSDQLSGRPAVVIFYLGFGCLHCVEQLHAFSPELDRFEKLGIDVVAISTESPEQLATGILNFEDPVTLPLYSNANQDAFKAFQCWDDFEDQPLHGTFLIDAKGRVRWQDIGHEPFLEVEFLLNESNRLLDLGK